MDDILTVLHNSEVDYLSISETWLNFSISDSEITVPGYNTSRFDRDGGNAMRGGGGIVVYSKDTRDFDHLTDWSLCCEDVQWTWSKLNLKGTRQTFIETVYRPPAGNVEKFNELLEQKVLDVMGGGPCDILILGDVNIDLSQPRSVNTRRYVNIYQTLGLKQLVKKATRVTRTSKSLIDHLLTTNEDLYVRGEPYRWG